jgi:hypothetical protein
MPSSAPLLIIFYADRRFICGQDGMGQLEVGAATVGKT